MTADGTDNDRVDLGLDSSGRRILLTRRMLAAFDAACALAGLTPVIVQGAFMAELGGGAAASDGYHDLAGCLDTRTWDLTTEQQERVLRAGRSVGWAVWRRDEEHGGMEEHHHWVLLGEPGCHPGAAAQQRAYLDGRDGLDTAGPDYHWRPEVIPLVPHGPSEPQAAGAT
ncbi:MAG: hypothetical protein ACXVXB_09630 [Nocardioidaceae bacterium]